jgi:hypothetical protein
MYTIIDIRNCNYFYEIKFLFYNIVRQFFIGFKKPLKNILNAPLKNKSSFPSSKLRPQNNASDAAVIKYDSRKSRNSAIRCDF